MSVFAAVADSPPSGPVSEDLLAELTDAAYRAALRHGLAGSFLDAQLDIWAALRSVFAEAEEK